MLNAEWSKAKGERPPVNMRRCPSTIDSGSHKKSEKDFLFTFFMWCGGLTITTFSK